MRDKKMYAIIYLNKKCINGKCKIKNINTGYYEGYDFGLLFSKDESAIPYNKKRVFKVFKTKKGLLNFMNKYEVDKDDLNLDEDDFNQLI